MEKKSLDGFLQRGILDSVFNADSKLTENGEIWLN